MDLQTRFDDRQLERIIDEASIYMCACPAQVASEIRHLRELIRYQRECMRQETGPGLVHQTIEAHALKAHVVMEDCLDRILDIEGWDRITLKMPAGLRALRDDLLDREG